MAVKINSSVAILAKKQKTVRGLVVAVCQVMHPWRPIALGLFWVFLFAIPSMAGQQGVKEADAFFDRGITAYQNGDMLTAIEAWSRALVAYTVMKGTKLDQAMCYQNIGIAFCKMGKYEQAIAREKQALEIFKTIRDTERQQADCYVNIGVSFQKMGKYEEAIAKQEQALGIYKAIKDTEQAQAICYVNIGVALYNLSRYEEAIGNQGQALSLFQAIKDTEREQAACYLNIGVTLSNMGKYKEAKGMQERALGIYSTIEGTKWEQADCYGNIGAVLCKIGEYEEAIVKQEQALRLYRTINGTEREQADCYGNIGHIIGELGNYEEEIGRYEQALGIYKAIKDTEKEQGTIYNNISVALIYSGRYQEAVAKQEEALRLYQLIKGTEREQADCCGNMGLALRHMGRYEEAMGAYQLALQIYGTIQGTESQQAVCWGNMGEAHLNANYFFQGIAAYLRAQRLNGSWWISRGLGKAYYRRGEAGDNQQALRALFEAIQLAEELRASVVAFAHRAGIFEEPAKVFPDFVGLLVELAQKKARVQESEVVRWSEDSQSDRAPLESAFHYADRGKGRALEDALREKASLKASTSDTKRLVEDRELSLRISKLTSLREDLPDTEAERHKKLTQDIEQLQQRRNMIEVELKRTAIGGYVAPEFRKPMDMAKELGPDTAVLQYSIGEKESWLLILTQDGVTAHRLGAETQALPELLPRQQTSISQLVEAWKKRPDKVGLDGLVQLARARAEDLGKRKTSERHNLVDAALQKAILERLGGVVLPDTAQLELQKKGIHHLLVIPDGSLHYIPFSMLRVKTDKGKVTGQYLVEQFAISYIPAMTTLDTIRKQRQERQEKRKGPRRELLAFANPDSISTVVPAKDDMTTRLISFRGDYYKDSGLNFDQLPEAETEAIMVASLFGPPKEYRQPASGIPEGTAVVYIGKGACEEEAKQLLTSGVGRPLWRYLLFSTHALADTQNGMLSCIKLSPPSTESQEDGFLQAQEVMGLELDADLVMLSACETGLGRMRAGEGLVGLTGAFFYAGAQSVCASLWQVPTEPTGRLGPTGQVVTEFFKNLKEGKVNKAEALRQAQLQVIRQGQSSDGKSIDYSDPFCWAAFVLCGEWK